MASTTTSRGAPLFLNELNVAYILTQSATRKESEKMADYPRPQTSVWVLSHDHNNNEQLPRISPFRSRSMSKAVTGRVRDTRHKQHTVAALYVILLPKICRTRALTVRHRRKKGDSQ